MLCILGSYDWIVPCSMQHHPQLAVESWNQPVSGACNALSHHPMHNVTSNQAAPHCCYVCSLCLLLRCPFVAAVAVTAHCPKSDHATAGHVSLDEAKSHVPWVERHQRDCLSSSSCLCHQRVDLICCCPVSVSACCWSWHEDQCPDPCPKRSQPAVV